jgi:phosphoribosylamine--glycine ligase
MLDLLEAVADEKLNQIEIELDDRTAATIFLVSGGYPGDIEKGKVIALPSHFGQDQWLFQAGTKLVGEQIQTNGGRVIAVTSLGADIPSALDRSRKLADEVQFEGKFHRTDIGMDLMQLLS